MNVGKHLSHVASIKADKKSIIFKESVYTYGEINKLSNSLANYLIGEGIQKGDVVAEILPNCPEFTFIYFAAMKIGAIFMPIDPKLGEYEIESILQEANPNICFTYSDYPLLERIKVLITTIEIASDEFRNSLKPSESSPDLITKVDEKDTALYLHTSGATNRPKIVELSYSNLDCFPKAMENCVVLGEEEVLGIVLPMSHISGPIILNLLLARKCRLVIIDSINPVSLFENIEKHRITYFHAVPPIFNLMLKSGFAERYDTSSLDIIAMMGTSVPVSLMNAFKSTFPHVTVLQGYGLTETSPLITLTRREDADRKRASIGTPVEGADVRVINEEGKELGDGEIGELIVKGPMVMKKYHALPEQNKARLRNGYFRTNDLVKYDRDNYYYHMGRYDDLIVLPNGQKVYPAEIQNVILSSPDILESAVVSIYSATEQGNVIHAFIVPLPGRDLNERDIRDLCASQLPQFKLPKKIHFHEALPKTSTGKLDIRKLKSELGKNGN
jgi:long-chain acyl-CoA synthetase